MRPSRRFIHGTLGVAVTCFLASLGATAGQAARTGVRAPLVTAAAFSAAPVQAAQAAYVGEETCLGCHTDYTRGYHDSAHGRDANGRTPRAQRGCESCHGPGGAHVEDPATHQVLRFKVVEPERASEACLTCHRPSDAHSAWVRISYLF